MISEHKRLKIAMIGHKAVPSRHGGIELVLTTLCPILVKKGFEVTCFNRSCDQPDDEYKIEIKNQKYKNVILKKALALNKKGLAAISSSFFASIKVALGNYDIIHYHAEGPCAMIWIPKLFKKKCIATVHGLDWQREKWKNGFGSKYIKFGEKMMVKYADEIIVLSNNVKEYFKKNYDRETNMIPNGVIKPHKRDPELINKIYGLKGNDYFCSVSRLTEEKGIHYLIEAYQKLHTSKKLVIAGDSSDTDDYVKKIKKMASSNPNIIFTGFISGKLLEEIYSNAYVYVIPSNLEGMPLSLLEAMSYGNAILGSSISEIKEVVEENAIIFEKSNINDLTKKLQLLSDSPNEVLKLKQNTSAYVCNKYNWDKIADKTLALYGG